MFFQSRVNIDTVVVRFESILLPEVARSVARFFSIWNRELRRSVLGGKTLVRIAIITDLGAAYK